MLVLLSPDVVFFLLKVLRFFTTFLAAGVGGVVSWHRSRVLACVFLLFFSFARFLEAVAERRVSRSLYAKFWPMALGGVVHRCTLTT